MNQNQNDTEPSLSLNVKRIRTHVRGGKTADDDGKATKVAQSQGGPASFSVGTSFSAAGSTIPSLPPRV